MNDRGTNEILLFGPTLVVGAHGRARSPGGLVARRLLAHLVLRQPEPVSAEELIDHAWGESVPESSRAALRMTISRLRRSLDPDRTAVTIVGVGGGYRLDGLVVSDVRRFERAVEASRTSRHDERLVTELARALDLWRGTPFQDGESTGFLGEQQRLIDLRLEAVERLVRVAEGLGRPGAAGRSLSAALADHPLSDDLVGLRMRALYADGDQSAALQVYDRHRERLKEELGVTPSPQLQELRLRIRRHELPTRAARPTSSGIGWVVGPTTARRRARRRRYAEDGDQAMQRAEVSADLGHWEDAAGWYQVAVDEALDDDRIDTAAAHCMRFAHVVWDPVIGDRVAATLEGLRSRIASEVVAAQVTLCLAGGLHRTGYEAIDIDREGLRAAVGVLQRSGSAEALGWGLTHLRDALTGELDTEASLAVTEQITAIDVDDALLRGQTARAAFVDLLRLDRRAAAAAVLRGMERPGADGLAANTFGVLAADNCWQLAMGRWHRVQHGLESLLAFSGRLGASTVDDVVLAQSFWLCRELGEPDAIGVHRDVGLAMAEQHPFVPHYRTGAALLAVELGAVGEAVAELERLAATLDFGSLPAGSHRSGLLAMAAEILGAGAAAGVDIDPALAELVGKALGADCTPGVLLGWPAVFAGPRSRFVGLAAFAAGNQERAERATATALVADRWMPAMRVRSLLARALVVGGAAGDAHAHEAHALHRRLRAAVTSAEGGA